MPEFNLLDEPWLLVMIDDKETTKEVSLKDLFKNAHLYKRLAGETPTQDFAILRLLLAVLHTVFSRFDAKGKQYDWIALDNRFKQTGSIDGTDDEDEYDYKEEAMLATWQDLWQTKAFPKIVSDYLEKWRDRFYLFGGEFPFYQFKEIADSDYEYDVKAYDVDKLDGLKLATGKNEKKKHNIFNASQASSMESACAIRWLIYVNAYAEARSGAPKGKKKESPGVAWLGRVTGFHAKGTNLFETLLLNLVMKINDQMSGIQKPIWETTSTIEEFKSHTLTYVPDNEAELYTYPSRLLSLTRNENKEIVSFLLDTGFSYFNKGENLHNIEPMTLWKIVKSSYEPIRVDPSRYFWQEFATYESVKSSRLVEWIDKIRDDLGDDYYISLVSVGEYYEQKDGKVKDSVVGALTERTSTLQLVNDETRFTLSNVSDEVTIIEKTSNILGEFAHNLAIIRGLCSSGKKSTDNKKLSKLGKDFVKHIKQDAYYQVDLPFRDWLVSIQPDDEKSVKIKEWRFKLRGIILNEAKKLLDSASNRDMIGIEDGGKIKNIFTAYNRFKSKLNIVLPREKEKMAK